jgi:hypothetical protein
MLVTESIASLRPDAALWVSAAICFCRVSRPVMLSSLARSGDCLIKASSSPVAGVAAGPLLIEMMLPAEPGPPATPEPPATGAPADCRPGACAGVNTEGGIVSAASAGESCQFQKRVRSIFSAELHWPSTASPSVPLAGSVSEERGGWNAWRWKRSSASCMSREVTFMLAATSGGIPNGMIAALPKKPSTRLATQFSSGTSWSAELTPLAGTPIV